MTPARLADTDWTAVADALERRLRHAPDWATRRLAAHASSLSARATLSFDDGRARLARAQKLDPLDATHRVREALFLTRFGQCDRAAAILKELGALLPAAPLPELLRALVLLTQGNAKQAATVARQVRDKHPEAAAEGRLIETSATIEQKLRGVERPLRELGAGTSPATMADLLAKVALCHPGEGPKLATKLLDLLPKGSRERALVERLLAWTELEPAVLVEELVELPAGSRAEEVVLVLLGDRLDRAPAREALERWHALHARLGERPAVRRAYVACLTRAAVVESGREDHTAALRLVERCLRLEPHESLHHQNRAVLFTLMRQRDAYHEAWAELDRHRVRFALLGLADPRTAHAAAKTHRMFAAHARLAPRPFETQGVFVERPEDDGRAVAVTVNQAQLDADPELLRWYVHQRAAELVWSHLALASDPCRLLLAPEEPRSARARAVGLTGLARSLAVLEPALGPRLAERLGRFATAAAGYVVSRLSPRPVDAEARALLRRHTELFADAFLLAVQWQPKLGQAALAAELAALLEATAPFLDGEELFQRREGGGRHEPLHRLRGFAAAALDLGEKVDEKTVLTAAGARTLVKKLQALLALSVARAAWEEGGGTERVRAEQALGHVDRARQLDPGSDRVEMFAAQFLLHGGFYDEARAVVQQFHRVTAKRESQCRETIEKIQEALDRLQRDQARSAVRRGGAAADAGPATERRAEELERELEGFPTSILTYEELVRVLCGEGRLDAALIWCDRAVARCLTRSAQLRARTLHLEVTALKSLAKLDAAAARRYYSGAHGPLRELIAACPAGARAYELEHLLGACCLAARRKDEAQEAFRRALERCTHPLHRAVIRPLAESVDHALLARAREGWGAATREQRFAAAFAEVGLTLAEVAAPEQLVVDVARIQLASVVASLGTEIPPATPPRFVFDAPWRDQLASACAATPALERVRRLASLALELHPPSKAEAEGILAKVTGLEGRVRMAEALGESSRLAAGGRLAEALAALDAARSEDPRVLAQRAALLLRLDRLDDAERAWEGLRTSEHPVVRELRGRWPVLLFKARLARVVQAIKRGAIGEARTLLGSCRPASPDEALEHAYHVALCTSVEGGRLRQEQRGPEAARLLGEAMALLEPHLARARELGLAHVLALADQVDASLEALERGP